MEKKEQNRITEGLLEWTEKESKLREVFGNGVINGRDFLGAKRDFFEELYKICQANPNREEKVMMAIVKGEIRKLDKRMYPNAAIRFLARLGGALKEWIQVDRQSYLMRDEGTSNLLKRNGTEYKVSDKRNHLRESNGQHQGAYMKKRSGIKVAKVDEKVVVKNESVLLPKKHRNPHNSHGID